MGMVQLYGNVFDLAHSYQEFGHMQCTPVTVHPRSEESRAISFRVTSDDTRPVVYRRAVHEAVVKQGA
jgi:hypothetical protein